MSITDELREYTKHYSVAGSTKDKLLTAIADRIDAETVELPKDADGVTIHVGDVLTDGKYTFVVYELAVFGDGSWSIRNEDGNAWSACDVTHYHEPTVEDVLREACNAYHSLLIEGMSDVAHDMPAPSEIIAEYAAKLRLADDGEGQQ